jgi:hypothetical protein
MSDSEADVRYESRFDTEAPMPQVGHGVWDTVEKRWIAQNLAGEAASWHAAILNLRYTETGERPDDCAWYRDPAPHVELRITASRTEAAKLYMWVREPDGLHGYVTYLERPARDGGRWAPAAALRQLTPDEIDQFAERQAARRPFSQPAKST